MRASEAVGQFGERLADRYLTGLGMEVLARRWRCRLGELDLVARDQGCLVVCEVKARRSVLAGTPLEAVHPAKLARLRTLSGLWLEQQPERFAELRIDVVAVTIPPRGAPRLEHLRGVG